MKHILTILVLFTSLLCFSQTYPKIEVDSSGNKVVVMTIEQAQKLDNNMEILSLLEKAIVDCDNLSNSYIKVIDEQKKTISFLELDVKLLKEQLVDKDLLISNLQQRLDNANRLSVECENQKIELNTKVTTLEGEITRLKVKKNVGYGIGVAGIIGLILLSILK